MKKLSITLFVIALGLFSCKNEADPVADKSFFTKFYDNSYFNAAYTPLDAVQTTDGGYVVMALKKLIGADSSDVDPEVITLMKTDEFGAFVSETELPEGLRIPVPSLATVSGKFYFVCISEKSLMQLVEVGEDATVTQQVNIIQTDDSGTETNIQRYPLALGVDGSSLMLLSFDTGSKNTVMSVISIDGNQVGSGNFFIGAADGPYAPEKSILDHVLKTGPRLPFFVGKAGSMYYFNGIYNYTLSTVFTDLNSKDPAAVVQGNNDDGGISALYPINGGKFAAARFNYGDNYLLPAADLTTSGFSTAADLGGNSFPELTPNAPVKIISAKINGTDHIIYGTNTKGKQIALFGFNPTDGSFVGSRYIGFSNTFELASITPTADGGLLVLGTTYIAGRFSRICLFKLSAEALGKSFQ